MHSSPRFVVAAVLGVSIALLGPRATAQDEAKKAEAGKSVVGSQENLSMDQQILSKMHQLNQMEVDIGQVGQDKAQSAKVKHYAERLARDHRFGDQKVTALAQKLNVTLVTPQPATPEAAQIMKMQMQMTEKLKGLNGSEFDTAFLQAMARGHQDAIAMLKNVEGQLPQTSPVRNLVSKMLPILQQHEHLATNLQKSTT